MTHVMSVSSLHDFYNEKFKTESKKYEEVIDQLNTKITNLKSEVSIVNKINRSLYSKLHSANNMIRILTSDRELDYDFTKVDDLLHTNLIENNCSGDTVKNNYLNIPKKVDSARNIGLKKVQNKPVLQCRNYLKTQHNQVSSTNNIIENQKVKPAANINTKISKIPVFAKPPKRNLNNNKENVVPSRKTTVANKKDEGGQKSNVNQCKGNAFPKKNTTIDHLKKVEKDAEHKKISMNKTFSIQR